MPRKYTPEERASAFWSRVDQSGGPDACWPWTGPLGSKGYGQATPAGIDQHAHRAAWILANGAIAQDLCVCHRCDNRQCCNPTHLFLGTFADNNRDMLAKGRQVYGASHGQTKLTAADVLEIRTSAAAGISQRELARKYGVCQTNIGSIVRGRHWRSIQAVH